MAESGLMAVCVPVAVILVAGLTRAGPLAADLGEWVTGVALFQEISTPLRRNMNKSAAMAVAIINPIGNKIAPI
ncbi:MAG: hypothetical protein ABEJ85_06325 [Haloarculaceae archaeon]